MDETYDKKIPIRTNDDLGRLYPDARVEVDGHKVIATDKGGVELGFLQAAGEGDERTFTPNERGRELIDKTAAGW